MKRRLSQIRPDVAFKEVMSGVCLLLEDLDNPISLAVYLLVKYEEWDQLVEKEVNPIDYLTDGAAQYFFDCYTAVSLVKKVENLPTSHDKSAIALEKFLEAERKCLLTNTRLLESHVSDTREGLDTSRLLSLVAHELKCILGPCPVVSELTCRFGPGASSSNTGTKVTVADKLNSRPEIGSALIGNFEELIREDPHFGAAVFNIGGEICGPFSALDKPHIVNFNKLSFVPKNGKTDRAICIEPTLNTYIQTGIGDAIRKRLFVNGLDLSKQHSKNAAYARKGSLDGSFATIDLSAASDSISSQLVLELLPIEWFELLYSARSAYTLLPDGRLLENNKFSSMGNGYTFELESAIFLAVARVAYRELIAENPSYACKDSSSYISISDFMTYGDDIIVPTCAAKLIIHQLKVLGFETNTEKTFTSGPFRESCGKDYFNGRLVRPFFIKKIPTDIRGYYTLCNGTRHLASRHSDNYYCDARFERTWKFFLSRIRKDDRHYGPAVYGDQVLFVNRPAKWPSKLHGLDRITLLLGVPLRSDQCKYRSNVVMQVCRSNSPSTVSLRKLTNTVKTKRVATLNWDRHYGQWIG